MEHNEDDKLKVEAYKKAMKEFLEEQKREAFENIGKWVLNFVTGAVAIVTLWFLAKAKGWDHP